MLSSCTYTQVSRWAMRMNRNVASIHNKILTTYFLKFDL